VNTNQAINAAASSCGTGLAREEGLTRRIPVR
jgi:hypothetical protein